VGPAEVFLTTAGFTLRGQIAPARLQGESMSGGYEIGLWALLIVASITDLIWGKIFNRINFIFFATAVIYRIWIGGFDQATSIGTAVLVAFAFFFPLYILKAMSAGDVKLLMVVGAWSNTGLVIRLGIVSIVFGAVVGAFILLKNRGIKAGIKSVGDHFRLSEEAPLSLSIPFAPALLCAFLMLHVAARYKWPVI
jgi:Flp pilus assembly protein protease CpaA